MRTNHSVCRVPRRDQAEAQGFVLLSKLPTPFRKADVVALGVSPDVARHVLTALSQAGYIRKAEGKAWVRA